MSEQTIKQVKCKFCGDMIDENKIIFGKSKNVNICEPCLEICNKIVDDRKQAEEEQNNAPKFLTPMEIKEKLDEYIVGQESAKKILSVAVYNHYKRIYKMDKDSCVSKANICLVGASGSGKTLMASTIAKLLDVPITIADANTMTSSGYVGRDVEDVLASLVRNADGDIQKAEKGIIVIDEIDKIAGFDDDNTRDIGGKGVQQALLKMIEGTKMHISSRQETEDNLIDTTNILFIVSGAFSGIEEIIARHGVTQAIGFGATSTTEKEKEHLMQKITQDDLIKYGMIPEFVGRIQTIAVLNKLDEDALIRILEEPKDALVKQYQELLAVDGIKLEFDKKAIRKIAKIAIKKKTGARSLKSIMENTMLDIMYYAPKQAKKKIVIKEEDIKAENV